MEYLVGEYKVRMKVKLLVQFYIENGEEPKAVQVYKGQNLGAFLSNIRYGSVKLTVEERKILEDLGIRLYTNNPQQLVRKKVKLLIEFFNEKGREPKFREIYKDEKIGKFLNNIRSGNVKLYTEEIKTLQALGIRLQPLKCRNDLNLQAG